MSRLWIGFAVACGVVAGAFFICQPGKAAEPALGSASARKARSSSSPAASPFQQQRPAAGTPDAKPPEEPLTVLKSGPDHVRVVCRLQNKPAADTCNVLQQLFRLEGGLHRSAATTAKGPAGSDVAIVPSIIDNSLVISGPPEAVEEVRRLLNKLDQSPDMLLLEMEMGLAPLGEAKPAERPDPKAKSSPAAAGPFRLLERPAKMETIARARLITLDNQPAFIQMGSRVPRVNSLSVASTGGETRSIVLDNVGLIVGITPRIDLDGAVTMQIDVEQSQLGPEQEGIPISVAGGKVIRSPRMDATTIQGTVRIPNAQTVILGSVAQKGANKELVIVVTPYVIRPEAAK